MTDRDRAALVVERRKDSYDWLRNNFYEQWRKVHRLYKCEVDPATDENNPSKTDTSKTRIGMPDIWSLVQRQVARITAQPPNLKFRAKDLDLAKKISHKLMYDWDRGGVQRTQKRHVAQACLFGISIRAWSWEVMEYPRTRRVDPLSDDLDEDTRGKILDQYADPLQQYQQEGFVDGMQEDLGGPVAMARLLGDHSRGNLLPIRETYKKYEGPKAHFLFIGDCFFEPNFQSLQSSNWFIVERRRNEAWIKRMARRYEDLALGFAELLKRFPKGTPNPTIGDAQNLRTSMMADIDRIDTSRTNESDGRTPEWTIPEMWTPGEECKVSYVGEDSVWIGEVLSPYDLDGKIPFTELVMIDDILSGIGDSNARIIRGLNELHNKHNSTRYDLIYNILRPLLWTTNRELYDNPELLKRGDGFRLVHARSANDVGVLGEQAAIASAAAGMQDEQGILRMIQMASGESNMSMAANVDPAQNRTATGARVLAFNQDILSKSATDMFNQALNDDVNMMYALNRSEMPEAVSFDAAQYTRAYAGMQLPDGGPTVPQQDTMTVSPLDFQIDGEVEAEVGSTLADDDEAEVVKAQNLFAMSVANPGLINQRKATDNLLIKFGYGKDLASWQPPSPPPPPGPEPPRVSATISIKFETLNPVVQAAVLNEMGLEPTGAPPVPLASPPPPKAPVNGSGKSPALLPPPGANVPTALGAAQGVNGPPQ